MITFDVLTIKAFISEKKDFLTGARINKIQQPTRREFLFTVRNRGKSELLYINIHPQLYHACFLAEQSMKKREITIPQKPPMFCMLLRKYIENAKILSVNQPENERIIEFELETSNSVGETLSLCLAIEFMGKHSNMILYEKGSKNIIGCAHNVGSEKSRVREVYGGVPYQYPPKQQKSDILNYNGDIDYKTLSNDFYMFSKSFALLCKDIPLEKLKSYIRLENISPAVSCDYSQYCLFSALLPGEYMIMPNVNAMIDNYYSYHIEKEKFAALRLKYERIVEQKLSKILNSISVMERNSDSYSDSEKYRLFGDLLMANCYSLEDYIPSVNLYDYENERNTEIPLDDTKTIKENANRYYKKYNKSKSAKIKLKELLEKAHEERIYLEQLKFSVDSAEDTRDLYEISSEIIPDVGEKPLKVKSEIYFKEFDDGTRIYIGKNNKQNDYIISKLASDEDLWFHVHNNAGSHVLLKTQNVTDTLIMTCAKLAKEHSSVKDSSKIGVIYTKRKYLRKPPGANLGYVTYKYEKEIVLD